MKPSPTESDEKINETERLIRWTRVSLRELDFPSWNPMWSPEE